MGKYRFNEHIIDNSTIRWDDDIGALVSANEYDAIVKDTSELVSALGNGRSVFIKKGQYIYNGDSITIGGTQGQDIIIAGTDDSIIYGNTVTPIFKTGNGINHKNIIIRGLTFVCPDSGVKTVIDRTQSGSFPNILFIGCKFVNHGDIYVGPAKNIVFVDCESVNGNGYFIKDHGQVGMVENCVIRNCSSVATDVSTIDTGGFGLISVVRANTTLSKIRDIFVVGNRTAKGGHLGNGGKEISLPLSDDDNTNIVIEGNTFVEYSPPSDPVVSLTNMQTGQNYGIYIFNNRIVGIYADPNEGQIGLEDLFDGDDYGVVFEHNTAHTTYEGRIM